MDVVDKDIRKILAYSKLGIPPYEFERLSKRDYVLLMFFEAEKSEQIARNRRIAEALSKMKRLA